MGVVWHYYCRMELGSLTTVVETVLKNCIPGVCGERRSG
jgi:hypothetical protein